MAQKIHKVNSWDELQKIVDRMDLSKETLTLCGYTFNSVLDYQTKKNFSKVWSLYFRVDPIKLIEEDEE